jgi:uncharacterized membrane protein YczE
MKQWIISNKTNLLYYVLGFVIMGFSVNIIKASNVGSGAWDTVTINIRSYFNTVLDQEWVTIGMVSFVVSTVIMIIVVRYRKQWRYLFMALPIFIAAIMIDFWNIVVFQDIVYTTWYIQGITYIIGLLFLPFALVLIVKSGFPAFVFDELMLMLVKVFKAKNVTTVRFGIEFLGLAIGSVFGYLTFFHVDGGLGVVNVGSLVFTILFTPIMAFYFKILKVSHD